MLLEAGALRPIFHPGSRKEQFQIEADLGILMKNYLNSRFYPTMDEVNNRLDSIQENSKNDVSPFLKDRVQKLRRWNSKFQKVVTAMKALSF